jgi:CBS domain containing-hemolysin-like protein
MNLALSLDLGILALAFALTAFVALVEVSIAAMSRGALRQLVAAGRPSALRIDQVMKDAERFVAGLLVWRTVSVAMAAAGVTWLALWLHRSAWFLAVALLSTGLLLLVVQVTARVVAVQHPDAIVLRLARPVQWALALVAPITWALMRVTRRAGLDQGSPGRNIFLTEDGLRLLLNFGEEEQFIEAEERELINSIFRFSERTVAEVMVPRVAVVGVEVAATLAEALDVCVTSGHSRIPVHEDTLDRIVGVLYAKDLLTHIREGKAAFSLREVMRKPYFVPESAMVNDLLGDLQHRKTHLAVVVDEYGGTAGIVTIEDLLEEIVGDIQDEYDREPPLIQPAGAGVFVVSGRVNLDDLNRELALKITDEDESYTLAGVIYSHLQRVPGVGDVLQLGGANLEVLSVTDNRIDQVRLVVNNTSEEAETTGDGGTDD